MHLTSGGKAYIADNPTIIETAVYDSSETPPAICVYLLYY